MKRPSRRGEAPRSTTPSDPQATLGELLAYLTPEASDAAILAWPPNVFALVAMALQRSGAYAHVLNSVWPPLDGKKPKSWAHKIGRIGSAWRRSATDDGELPREIADWWSVVTASFACPLSEIARAPALSEALLQLSAAADEASVGVGSTEKNPDDYAIRATLMLMDSRGATLANRIHTSKLRVLPKQHTPSGGMTIRSLSHHLALYVGADVVPYWHDWPTELPRNLNLLLAPWPQRITPQQIRPAPRRNGDPWMPDRFNRFTYQPREDAEVAAKVLALLRRAREVSGRVDGVIMPELALSASEYASVRDAVLQEGSFLLAGVSEPGHNYLMLHAPLGETALCVLQQHKHHRWRLDRSQIGQYGLGCTLDPTQDWWEDAAVGNREVHFAAINDSLIFCCLICEDLARQEPVGELVRAVGPNLVVALLMDAPQLGARWPARYATVLADDPGCSVLTLTSVGMVDLSRPPPGGKVSRSIALWKDAGGRLVEIELDTRADGVLLSLGIDAMEEWTADTRSDGKAAAFPRLTGVHQIHRASS